MLTNCECGRPFSVDHSLNCLREIPCSKTKWGLWSYCIPTKWGLPWCARWTLPPTTNRRNHETQNSQHRHRSQVWYKCLWFLRIMLWESLYGCVHLQSQGQITLQSHHWSLFQTTWARRSQYSQHIREVKHACIILCYIVTLYITTSDQNGKQWRSFQ